VTFDRPDLLIFAPAAAALLVMLVLLQWRRGRRLVQAYGGRAPSLRLLGRDLTRLPLGRLVTLALGAAALGLVAAGPTPEQPDEPPPPTPIDLSIAVDVSHSMSAGDVDGERIARARELVDHIVQEGVADRISLSLFADWPFDLVPMTDDQAVVSFFSPWLTPALVGTRDQGTSMPAAIGSARQAWERRPREDARRIVLLVSDGEIYEGAAEALDSARAVSDAGFEVWVAGVGSADGAPLFLPGSDGAPLLFDGAPVVAGYDRALLEELASAGRGRFHDVSTVSGIRSLVGDLGRDRPSAESTGGAGRAPAFWLLIAALVLLAIEASADAGVFGRSRRGDPAAPAATVPRSARDARSAARRGRAA